MGVRGWICVRCDHSQAEHHAWTSCWLWVLFGWNRQSSQRFTPNWLSPSRHQGTRRLWHRNMLKPRWSVWWDQATHLTQPTCLDPHQTKPTRTPAFAATQPRLLSNSFNSSLSSQPFSLLSKWTYLSSQNSHFPKPFPTSWGFLHGAWCAAMPGWPSLWHTGSDQTLGKVWRQSCKTVRPWHHNDITTTYQD